MAPSYVFNEEWDKELTDLKIYQQIWPNLLNLSSHLGQ